MLYMFRTPFASIFRSTIMEQTQYCQSCILLVYYILLDRSIGVLHSIISIDEVTNEHDLC